MYREKILQCLAETINVDLSKIEQTDPQTELDELGFTSILFVDFILRIEEIFGIEVLDSDLLYEKFSTIEKTISTLCKYLDEKATPRNKKVLILDADNVLWKGISGEEPISIDDDVVAFQEKVIDWYNRGVLLCLCSKNEASIIDKAFSHPKMLLTKNHFVSFYANRIDKATNILSIADELNLTVDSFVFVDDSDYELGFVSANLPEITTIKADYSLDFQEQIEACFSSAQASSDLNRTQLYREQKQREKERKKFVSIEEYNQSLETVISCDIAMPEDCSRLAELSQRTHQFNLSAAEYTEEEFAKMLENPRCVVIKLTAKDKYGDMGLVGLAIVYESIIEAFMLSCRVFGRDFEIVLLDKVKTIANPSRGVYRDNGKNQAYKNFYVNNGVVTE